MEIKYQAHFIKLNYRLRRKLTVFYTTEEQKLAGIYLNFQETESKKTSLLFTMINANYTLNTRRRIPKGNEKREIHRNWQQRVHKTKENKAKTQYNYMKTNRNNVH